MGLMPDDSVSEITDIEEEEILTKYYRNKHKTVTDKRDCSIKRTGLDGS